MPITKKTSAGTIIGDFENSDNPKFAGKSKEERRKMALGAYYAKHPEKSNKNESVEITELEKGGYDAHQAMVDTAARNKAAEPKPKPEPKITVPKSTATHVIIHPSGLKQPHTGTDATAHAAAAKVGGTVKSVPQMTHESISNFIDIVQSGDKVAAQQAFSDILMDKVASRMEELKIATAQSMFGFGEAAKFDDEDDEPENKKKGEDVRKARRAKAMGKYKKPEIDESTQIDEASLTRKHMIAAAKEVATHTDPQVRQTLHDHHAKIFAASNPRFDAAKFKAACNL